jgi:hypothetical protein
MEPPMAMVVPLHRIESDLASSAHHFHLWFGALQDRIASTELPVLSLYVVREIAAIDRRIEVRLNAWGWDFVQRPDGLNVVQDKLDAHRTMKYYPYLDAVLSSRSALELPRNRGADDEADRARMLGIKPTMIPEEGERVRQQRYDDWYFSPALTSQKPTITIEKHDELVRCVDIVNGYFRNLIPPDQEWDSARENEEKDEAHRPSYLDAETAETCKSEPAAPTSRKRRRKGGRPPDTDAKEDRRIAQAWKTGNYSSLEDLAKAIGKKKHEVRKALDRHRHRDGKNGSRKSRQAQ